MRELDLNNKNYMLARNSVYNHYDDLEQEINEFPDSQMLLKRLKITMLIVENINIVIS